MRIFRTFAAALLSLALIAAPLVSAAGASDESTVADGAKSPNVLVKITLGRIEGGQRKPMRSYQLLASGSGYPARMSTANRIPVYNVASGSDDKHPVTSYSYQNVGFQANVRAWVLANDGSVRINADIEDTALLNPASVQQLDSGSKKEAPVVTSFSQSIEAMLRGGVPALSTLVDDPKGQSLYIQLGAEIQR